MQRKNLDLRDRDLASDRPSPALFDDELVTHYPARRPSWSQRTLPWSSTPTALTADRVPEPEQPFVARQASAPSDPSWLGTGSVGRREPVGHELDDAYVSRTRPRSSGLAFALVSLVLVGLVTGGVVFFGAQGTAHAPTSPPVPAPVASVAEPNGESIGTTQLTNAEAPVAPSPADATGPGGVPAPSLVDPAARATPVSALSAAPSAPTPPPATTPRSVGRKRTESAKGTSDRARLAHPPAASPAAERALPDLDRAQRAASVPPGSSANPETSSEVEATPGPSPSDPTPSESASPAPPPSEVLPELKLQP